MPLDPASLLKPVEQRIERGDVETQRPARTGLDQFGNLVAVPLPNLNERKDQQLGAALLQFAVENSSVYICHSHILCRLIYGVNRRRVPGKNLDPRPSRRRLGKRIRVNDEGTEAWATIVGVAAYIVQRKAATNNENPYYCSFSIHLDLRIERGGSSAAGRDIRHAQRAC